MRTVGPGEAKELAKVTHLMSETQIQFDPKAQGLDSFGRGIILPFWVAVSENKSNDCCIHNVGVLLKSYMRLSLLPH